MEKIIDRIDVMEAILVRVAKAVMKSDPEATAEITKYLKSDFFMLQDKPDKHDRRFALHRIGTSIGVALDWKNPENVDF